MARLVILGMVVILRSSSDVVTDITSRSERSRAATALARRSPLSCHLVTERQRMLRSPGGSLGTRIGTWKKRTGTYSRPHAPHLEYVNALKQRN